MVSKGTAPEYWIEYERKYHYGIDMLAEGAEHQLKYANDLRKHADQLEKTSEAMAEAARILRDEG